MGMLDSVKKVYFAGKLFCSNHKADILVGSGIFAIVGGVVAACVGARKMDDILDEHEFEVSELKAENAEKPLEKSEYNREMAKIYGKTTLDMTKAFAPAVILVGTGISLVLKSHFILKNDKMKLIAAYNVLDSSYKSYRERVISKYGEEEDRRLRFGTTEGEKEVEVEEKDGKIKKKKEKVDIYPENCSDYARIFNGKNTNWHREEYEGPYAMVANFMFLEGIERACNRLLDIRGQLTLNDVYHELGMPLSAAGAVVGWRSINNGGTGAGVSFGIKDRNACIVLSDGLNEGILLDFNVEGVIIDSKFDEISGTDGIRP